MSWVRWTYVTCTNYKVIHHTLTYREIIISMIILICITYSPTYESAETDDMHRYWHWQWQYCRRKMLLFSSNCKKICGTPHWYGQLRSSHMPDSSWSNPSALPNLSDMPIPHTGPIYQPWHIHQTCPTHQTSHIHQTLRIYQTCHICRSRQFC